MLARRPRADVFGRERAVQLRLGHLRDPAVREREGPQVRPGLPHLLQAGGTSGHPRVGEEAPDGVQAGHRGLHRQQRAGAEAEQAGGEGAARNDLYDVRGDAMACLSNKQGNYSSLSSLRRGREPRWAWQRETARGCAFEASDELEMRRKKRRENRSFRR